MHILRSCSMHHAQLMMLAMASISQCYWRWHTQLSDNWGKKRTWDCLHQNLISLSSDHNWIAAKKAKQLAWEHGQDWLHAFCITRRKCLLITVLTVATASIESDRERGGFTFFYPWSMICSKSLHGAIFAGPGSLVNDSELQFTRSKLRENWIRGGSRAKNTPE